jgi:glutamyl-tRNA synthetase
MSVRVRFAPSPTGFLHVGGARTALYNYLFARRMGGTFVLRIEDTDAERSNEASVAAILAGLRWLGLRWDEGPGAGGDHGPYFQSARRESYRQALDRLVAADLAYPAYETPEELESLREAQAARGEGPSYDGRGRHVTAADRARFEAEGRAPAWRLRVPEACELAWDDVVRGRVVFQSSVIEDFVLVRSDGLPTYNFACVVDDIAMGITHVIRGDDHISNTPRQLLLYRALGVEPPVFAHASMILGPDGKRLSKRHGATSVEAFGEMGIVPEAMVNFLALLGWALDGERELFALQDLEQVFSLERVGPNPAVFNVEKLEWMNGQHLKRLDEEERTRRVVGFLESRGHDLSGRSGDWRRRFVLALGDRVRTLADAEDLGAFVLREPLDMAPSAWADLLRREGAGARLAALADRLAADAEYSLATIEQRTRALAVELGVKPGEVITPARVALTGRTTAPGIFDVMWLLGRERTVSRLRDAAARWSAESPANAGS